MGYQSETTGCFVVVFVQLKLICFHSFAQNDLKQIQEPVSTERQRLKEHSQVAQSNGKPSEMQRQKKVGRNLIQHPILYRLVAFPEKDPLRSRKMVR